MHGTMVFAMKVVADSLAFVTKYMSSKRGVHVHGTIGFVMEIVADSLVFATKIHVEQERDTRAWIHGFCFGNGR